MITNISFFPFRAGPWMSSRHWIATGRVLWKPFFRGRAHWRTRSSQCSHLETSELTYHPKTTSEMWTERKLQSHPLTSPHFQRLMRLPALGIWGYCAAPVGRVGHAELRAPFVAPGRCDPGEHWDGIRTKELSDIINPLVHLRLRALEKGQWADGRSFHTPLSICFTRENPFLPLLTWERQTWHLSLFSLIPFTSLFAFLSENIHRHHCVMWG